MTGHPIDDDVLPIRSAAELRHVVGERVVRARRRRRVRRAALPAVLAVAAALAFASLPDGALTLNTPGPENGPASEGTEVGLDEGRVGAAGGPAPAGQATPGAEGLPSTGPALPSVGGPVPGGPSGPATGGATEVDVRLAVTRMADVWELRADGTPVRMLVEKASSPAWSPDGRRVAYTQFQDSLFPSSAVWVIDLVTSERRHVSNRSDATHWGPTFSPDGTLLAFSQDPSSNATPPDAASSVVVVDLDAPAGNDRWTIRDATSPAWSPDGRLLHRCDTVLCISSANGANRVQIPNSQDLSETAWSPDGAWITGTDYSDGGLFALRADGSSRRRILDRVGAGGAAWSPDGTRLYYPTDDGIRSVRLDGSDVRVVTKGSLDQYVAVVRR